MSRTIDMRSHSEDLQLCKTLTLADSGVGLHWTLRCSKLYAVCVPTHRWRRHSCKMMQPHDSTDFSGNQPHHLVQCVSNPTWWMEEQAICYFYIIIIIRVTTSNRLAAELAQGRRQHSSKGDCDVRHIRRQSGVSACTYCRTSLSFTGTLS